MSDGYTKLFASILDSTVWAQPNHVKLMWVTMLAMKGHDGVVEASIPGLARRAGVTIPEAEESLLIFMSPDPYSRSKELEGRRIIAVDGGWALVNHGKYKHRASEEDTRDRAAARQKAFRERDKAKKASKPGADNPDTRTVLRDVTDRYGPLRVTENNGSNDIRGRSESDQNRSDQTENSETPTPLGGGVVVHSTVVRVGSEQYAPSNDPGDTPPAAQAPRGGDFGADPADDTSAVKATPPAPAQAPFRRNASVSGSHVADFCMALGMEADALGWSPRPMIGRDAQNKIIERCREYAHGAGLTFLEACHVIAREGLALANAMGKSPAGALMEVVPGRGPPRRFGGGKPERARATTGKDFADAAPLEDQLKRLEGNKP